ncbi:MAG: type II toxin-antitoxin system prevent-host-death family antitoxin [Candidatus Latescibacterota bacterium]|nr:MAG: DUF2281 domain-containing protein [Candidatus Latescibacteria bacterium 4484_107]RKY72814.1 MAG: type II toxin-antitoxin system prevent-host-death family antitoxin [Candidatus Latescibacterota bacterium]
MRTLGITQAQRRLPELIEQTLGGEDVVITGDDRPLVRLVAVAERRQQRPFGSARGLIRISDDFDEPLDDFREYK